ncbi:hypothetical protein C4K05_3544 [Pseudomonas chlororaphis subsp. aureofaciens]|uniref:Uncharacterized protein n=1 Tax=Pseudomonas chlororaphis subsp. aureofaciens TaxID=587851 RepID=A0AAD1E6P8_9PSED|nr:hypothetical protein C4K08_3549 [Pseudomonas chlororaphis subsp. aureofaciens]AZE30242.1 hypothetical protein C4K07_3457 [Pseudomonas chlororaphis subsp. aureofaciens]AZE36536.1 hypothetical protein C4K06_3503 [Pseudomonas chlororaphis subsp. aureofaciens]AZE42884.1 hypothetical protein C4K05_3544 [Pseudomonas chlororaphis subsp. aureofaciens]
MLPVGRDLDPGRLHKCGAALLFIVTIIGAKPRKPRRCNLL